MRLTSPTAVATARASVIANNLATPSPEPTITTVILETSQGRLDVRVDGDGATVVLLPSLGRGASDFDDLASRLVTAKYRAVRPEPRGVGASVPAQHQPTMADLAADVADVVRATSDGPATIVGHAFGNRVARQTATAYPELVDRVVLLACGGKVPGDTEAMAALGTVFDAELAPAQHLDVVRTAFFAPGNDASVWEDGWHADVATVQSRATLGTPAEEWWHAGSARVLVVQPEHDRVAPVANADAVVDALGTRATLVTVRGAGHALLPERPDAVAAAVLAWLAT